MQRGESLVLYHLLMLKFTKFIIENLVTRIVHMGFGGTMCVALGDIFSRNSQQKFSAEILSRNLEEIFCRNLRSRKSQEGVVFSTQGKLITAKTSFCTNYIL